MAIPPVQINIPPPPDQASATGVLKTSSDLVRIDVQVTDGSGRPIKGLNADQFTITDNGKPQKISSFSYEDIEAVRTAGGPDDSQPVVVAVDTPPGANAETIANQVKDRRMLVLYFDLSSMQPDDTLRARDAATKFINTQMSPADLVAVVAYGLQLSIWCDFTNDHAKLLQAVSRLSPGVANELAGTDTAAAQNGDYSVTQDTSAAFIADQTEFNTFNTDAKLEAIEGLANVLSAIPGRKSVIEFSGGITQTGEENRTELRAVTDAANRADVSIYSIDARGLFAIAPGGDVTSSAATGSSMFTGASVYAQTDSRLASRDTLATLSSDTGGRAFYDLGDLSDALPDIQKDNSGYYLVGYYLDANIKHDGSWHTIRVKVNARGAHLRSRDGYYAPRDFQHREKQDKEDQLQEALESDNPIVELPIAVETAAFRLSSKQVYVPISAKISSSALDWAEKHNAREAGFDFAAEVRALPSGTPVADLRDTINVKLDPSNFDQIRQSNLLYQGAMVLSPGNYRLKFIARENESGKIGTFEQNMSIPPEPNNRMTLSSVMLSSQLVAAQPAAPAGGAKLPEVKTKSLGDKAKNVPSPLEVHGQKIVPSVTRFFNTQQTLYVFFQAYYPQNGDNGDSLDGNTIRGGLVFFRNGVQVNATPLNVPTEFNPDTRTATFRVSLPLSRLEAGRYTVQAVAVAAGTQQAAFGRAYLALEPAATTVAAAPGAQSTVPPTPPIAVPPSSPPELANP
jgi:VWFA-related protein